MFSNIYRLGHCTELAIEEFKCLTGGGKIEVVDQWLFSDQVIDTNISGSVVFGGEILQKYNKSELKIEILHEFLSQYIQSNKETVKKIGISLPTKFSKNFLGVAKKAGAKKINIIKDQLPNYGHKKSVKNWLVITEIQHDVVVFSINSYSDQQFWSELDQKLPNNDMKRGIINIKLARSLVNLTKNSKLIDPFNGVGRLAISSLDKQKIWRLSDIDKVCEEQTMTNLEAANYLWKIKKNIITQDTITISTFDAKKISELEIDLSDFSVVTEGFLGFNPGRMLRDNEIKNEYDKLKDLWTQVLQSCQTKGIKEIIFCLPFYNITKKPITPDWIFEIAEQTNYNVNDLNGKKMILYKRAETKVGHAIIKLTV
jgi:hypothetical protein